MSPAKEQRNEERKRMACSPSLTAGFGCRAGSNSMFLLIPADNAASPIWPSAQPDFVSLA